MTPIDVVDYDVDAADRVVRVTPAWSAFAIGNGAPQLSGDSVIGRSLWSFLTDQTTREVYGVLMARARQGVVSQFPFRCDSPDLRRYMEMVIRPLPLEGVRFASATLRVESRPFQRFWSSGEARDTSLVHTCAWCKRVTADGIWLEVEEAVWRLGLFTADQMPELTHGVCPDCLVAVLGEGARLAL